MSGLWYGQSTLFCQSPKMAFSKLVSFLFLAFIVSSACKSTQSPIKSSSAEISNGKAISTFLSSNSRVIPPGLMCFNVNSVRVKSWKDPNFISAVKLLSPKVLRIPGGEVANYWDWKRGGIIQNDDNLPDGLPSFLSSLGSQVSSNKLEDFKFGFEKIGTTPLFVLNMLSSSLDSQLNMLKQAEELGMPVREIELGNEFYFGTKNNKAIFSNPEDYAEAASQWANQIRKEFPNSKIGVVGVENYGLETYKKMRPRRRTWNSLIFPSTLSHADAVTFHIYTKHGLEKDVQSSDKTYPSFDDKDVPLILGEPFRYWEGLKKDDEFSVVPIDKEIWITEYNLFEKNAKKSNQSPKVIGSWTHGLYTLAMSLMFLEDSRIGKICNHVLVGSSQFSAIYADTNSFINPIDPSPPSIPNSLSATGSSLKLLGKALNGATAAQQLQFSGGLILEGNRQFQYPALYGWVFMDENSQKRAVVMNLSNSFQSVDFSMIFSHNAEFEQISAPPRTLIFNPDKLTQRTGLISDDSFVLSPYSVTFLSDS